MRGIQVYPDSIVEALHKATTSKFRSRIWKIDMRGLQILTVQELLSWVSQTNPENA